MFSKQAAPEDEAEVVYPIRPATPGPVDARLADTYRRIFASLDLPANLRPAIVGVTSAVGGEGRTTVALGLARTLAADLDEPVSLVELDLERPALARQLDVAQVPGLCEVLRGEYLFREVGRAMIDNLLVITAGAIGPDASRLLHRVKTHDPLRSPHGLEGVVILDLPPLLDQGYGAVAASVADAVVLVVRSAVTPADVVREAVARLEKPPRRVVAAMVVITDSRGGAIGDAGGSPAIVSGRAAGAPGGPGAIDVAPASAAGRREERTHPMVPAIILLFAFVGLGLVGGRLGRLTYAAMGAAILAYMIYIYAYSAG